MYKAKRNKQKKEVVIKYCLDSDTLVKFLVIENERSVTKCILFRD